MTHRNLATLVLAAAAAAVATVPAAHAAGPFRILHLHPTVARQDG